ncbi:hypothetical protein RNI52_26120 [Labrys neptuniae]|uniref:hypothetical protein n=1 Tax=Labrys neptuniae TaxID=376174 RepID=UPI002891B6EA|nr:hypothetical protein [Labrys neptuniae]MDT3380829.1 hypothetical protein [Labrys neptuniae]
MNKPSPPKSICYLQKIILIFTVIFSAVAARSVVRAEEKAPIQGLAADLAFHFKCSTSDTELLAITIEKFLQERGFRVLNKARLAKENNINFPYTLNIIGIDAQNRIFNILGFPSVKDNFSLGFNSPPPTRHDTQLEDSTIDFVNNKLQCKVRQVSRGENTAELNFMYTPLVEMTRGWFKQAEELKRQAP